MTTPNLGAPELVQSQAVPETTVNEQVRYVEQGANCFRFVDRDLATPPGSPVDGACYLVAASPTGAWSGHAGDIAFYMSTSWDFIEAKAGMRAYVIDEDAEILFDGTSWGAVGGGGGASALGDLSDVDTTGVTSGQVLAYDGTQWEPTTLGGADTGIEGAGDVVRLHYANGTSGDTTRIGWSTNGSGTAGAPTVATTNRLTRNPSRATRATGTSTNADAGWRTGQAFSRDAGFTYQFRGGIETLAGTTTRLFIGVRASATLLGGNEPSSLQNTVGFGCDAADANIQLMHNDGTGTATKVDTGIAKAAGDELFVEISCAANGDYEVTLKQFAGANLTTTPTATYTATVSSDMPTASSLLAAVACISNGSTASSAVFAFSRESLRTPF